DGCRGRCSISWARPLREHAAGVRDAGELPAFVRRFQRDVDAELGPEPECMDYRVVRSRRTARPDRADRAHVWLDGYAGGPRWAIERWLDAVSARLFCATARAPHRQLRDLALALH